MYIGRCVELIAARNKNADAASIVYVVVVAFYQVFLYRRGDLTPIAIGYQHRLYAKTLSRIASRVDLVVAKRKKKTTANNNDGEAHPRYQYVRREVPGMRKMSILMVFDIKE